MLNPYDLDLGSACDRLRSVTVVRVDTGILSRVVVEFGVTPGVTGRITLHRQDDGCVCCFSVANRLLYTWNSARYR